MLSCINFYQELRLKSKRPVNITAILTTTLTPGLPAMYIHKGLLVRTTAVENILEASTSHVKFETKDIIYTISFEPTADIKIKITA